MAGEEAGERVAVGDPERDVIERLDLHACSLATGTSRTPGRAS
jgi:hypothetical protein